MEMPQPPYPLHSSVADRLALQYVNFYNRYVIHLQQAHYQPVAASRVGGSITPGASQCLPVGKILDVSVSRLESTGPVVPIRCFVPEGDPPSHGWPVVLYYHGGGWVLGDISSENSVCSNMCARARSVVITTDYRLAPEFPFPAAVYDSFETLLWTMGEGQKLLNLDLNKVGIGGSSAGANLAAVTIQKALSRSDLADQIRFKIQLLVVPVTDNTATLETNPTYREYEYTAALPAAKMLWYRNHYLPEPADRWRPEASPLLASCEILGRLPRTVILVAELDVVRHEGEAYARKLKLAGTEVRLEVMIGMPHSFLAMDRVLDEGRRAVTILCDSLSEAMR